MSFFVTFPPPKGIIKAYRANTYTDMPLQISCSEELCALLYFIHTFFSFY